MDAKEFTAAYAEAFGEAAVLGFAVPMTRFRQMCGTMRASCLFGTHAWNKVRDRINKN